MKTLFKLLKTTGNLNASFTIKDGDGVISIRPITDGIKDDAVSHIRDLTIRFDENDSEMDLVTLLEGHIPKAVEKVTTIKSFQEGLEKAESEKKENKLKQEKAKKAIEALEKALDPKTEKKESEHTKMFNEFKEEFKTHKNFSKIEKMFNDKYVSLDLFNQ